MKRDALRVTCPDCRKALQLSAARAGQRVRCPGCFAIIPVPASALPQAVRARRTLPLPLPWLIGAAGGFALVLLLALGAWAFLQPPAGSLPRSGTAEPPAAEAKSPPPSRTPQPAAPPLTEAKRDKPAPALPSGRPGTRYAFLVGCSDYLKAEFKDLPFTGNDVQGLREALIATGFAADNIVVMYDDKGRRYIPEKVKILTELDLLLDGMRPEDTLVVALSGHGLQYKGDPVSYFVPLDGKTGDKSTLIALDGSGGVYARLKACKAQKKLLLINACRNDPTVSYDFAANRLELTDEDRDEVPEGIAAIYSCSAGQKSYYLPERKRALFFDHVIRAWKGEYADGKRVTLEHVLHQVATRTRMDANKTFAVKQTPHIKREYHGEWVISAEAAPRAEADLAAGRKLLRAGEPAQAVPLLDKAIQADTGQAPARVARGVAHVRLGKFGPALADFKEAARLDERNAEAALQVGWMHYYGYGVTPTDYAEAGRWFKKAAELGDSEAMAAVGMLHGNGRGVPRDYAEAVQWYRRAVGLGQPVAMIWLADYYRVGRGTTKDEAEANRLYAAALEAIPVAGADRPITVNALGVIYQQRGEDAVAVGWYRKAAELGSPLAMSNLAWMYANGRGIAKDARKAADWYRKAAELGEPLGMRNLGIALTHGQGMAKDAAEALRWFRRGADLGDVRCLAYVALAYELGRGMPADLKEAARLYRQAADRGDALALCNLGAMYVSGRGVPKDDAEAFQLFRKGAEQSDPGSMSNFGWMYQQGLGARTDDTQAVYWFKKAAEMGEARAISNLGTMYDMGRGGLPRSETQAFQLYQKAAAMGEPMAMKNLAGMYETGRGAPRNREEAIRWYRKAAEKGDGDARNSLNRLLKVGAEQSNRKPTANVGGPSKRSPGVPADAAETALRLKKADDVSEVKGLLSLGTTYEPRRAVPGSDADAFKQIKKAAMLGEPVAMKALAGMYETGRGVARNREEALRWYRRAAESGDSDAYQGVIRLTSNR